MSVRVVVVGAGVGGLSAARALARAGCAVRVLEARPQAGGLASGLEADGLRFDGGPYILLDRPGLAWAFHRLGLDLEPLRLQRLDPVYTLETPGGAVSIQPDLDATVAGLERAFPGCGPRYAALVARGRKSHARLEHALRVSRPGWRELLHAGAWRELPTLLGSLQALLARSGLPAPVRDAVAVWTHVAGQDARRAPAFMGLIPALIHGVGAFVPQDGLAAVPRTLLQAAREAGAVLETGRAVLAIHHEGGRVRAVEAGAGKEPAEAVVSDVGLSTYLALLRPGLPRLTASLARWPLQSPGVSAYLAVRGQRGPYLRFRLDGQGCRLLVQPVAADGDGWRPARLIAPLAHARAERLGAAGQQEHLERLLAEDWWRAGLLETRVVARRVPASWGEEFHLHRESMNPAMSARLSRSGRLAHRSPHVRGLYLAGAATHPGQWLSFCAISGVLAAQALCADFGLPSA